MIKLSLIATMVIIPCVALAAEKPHVNISTIQKGVYEDPECEKDESFPDACLTVCKVSYPVVDGIEALHYQKALNEKWEKKALAAKCQGKKVAVGLTADRSPNEFSYTYELLLNDYGLLSFSENNYSYGSGAAHGVYASNGVIIDSKYGKELGTGDLLDMNKIEAINAWLVKQIQKDEERVFDEIRNADPKELPPYISETNREFTLMLKKDGLYAQFGIYQIGPYSSGEIDYKIPRKFIKSPHILTLLDDLEIRDAQR